MAATPAKAQAAYFLITGVWPLVHRRSFEAVTGPKVDFWLVRTVGVVVAAIGGGLALSARRGPSRDLELTALLAAAGLAAVDVVEVSRARISRVYLLDALIEAAIVAAWAARGKRAIRRSRW
jgi:hypothetical protein